MSLISWRGCRYVEFFWDGSPTSGASIPCGHWCPEEGGCPQHVPEEGSWGQGRAGRQEHRGTPTARDFVMLNADGCPLGTGLQCRMWPWLPDAA